VTPVNDVPVIFDQQPLEMNEDTELTITPDHLTVEDVDNTPANFSVKILSGTDYTVSENRVVPVADFNGTLTVSIAVSDGMDDSDPFDVSINVVPVNDVPVISAQQLLEMNEDSELTITPDHLTVEDVDNTPSNFSVKILPGANYTLSGNRVVPAADFNGTLTVPVAISDGTNDSDTFTASVKVLPVNDAPKIITAKEFDIENGIVLSLSMEDIEVKDVDNETSALTLEVLSGSNYTVSGNVIQANAGFRGVLEVGVRVKDGTTISELFLIIVNVTLVTGLETDPDKSIQVYPNPVKYDLRMENTTNVDILNIQVISADGKPMNVRQTSRSDGTSIMDVSHLSNGNYFVRIQTTQRVIWKRIVIIR
jgi:hypothetical protein